MEKNKREMPKCLKCGDELELVLKTTKSKFDKVKLSDEDDSTVYVYKCKSCGAVTRVEDAPESEYVDGDLHPCECEHNFTFEATYPYNEVYKNGSDDDRLVDIFVCRLCGSYAYIEHD